ncbi:MAG: glycine/betaine ABC transporter substrate-binding protein [Candidatus Eremiobacteraeota bacterium]|nr:glycine/betaine ABC transporter substrate-binding protein [Candidatus Eremiobacteraeota bacterium]
MNLTRGRALTLLGAAALLPHCAGSKTDAVRVGSKNFTEAIVMAELYAQTLEAAGIAVERKFNLGSTQIAMAALQRGDIDLYPEYTGTGLIDVLHRPPMRDATQLYDTLKTEFVKRFNLVWLDPSPMNDSQGLATTQAIAQRYRIKTLSQLSSVAPQLRLGAVAEFLDRADALPGLQKFYGGFRFKDVKTYEIGLKYKALLSGQADVVTAFTTDALIDAEHLIVLTDDKHFWPEYHVAPVVRQDALAKFPKIRTALNTLAPSITDAAARSMNAAVDVHKQEPAEVAAAFLKQRHP